MKIKQINSQHRRDFYADYECENCRHIESDSYGYDDRNFRDNVIPAMKCKQCGKSSNDLGIVSEKTATKYPEWKTV